MTLNTEWGRWRRWSGVVAALVIFSASSAFSQQLPPPKCEHVLLVVWDGMRPDFIRPDLTPNAWKLAQRGTFFARNHSTYITTTEVNGSTIATGMKPRGHGIFGNAEYRPTVNLIAPIATEGAWSVRVGDALSGGRWMLAPTIAERVRLAGGTTAIAGTKDIALLHDRASTSGHIFGNSARPASALDAITALIGKRPKAANADYTAGKEMPEGWMPAPNTEQNLWTTRALIEHEWRERVPRFSTLWLGDPDFSQHMTRPGAATALEAIGDSDRHLGLAVAALEKRGILERTNIFLVSDHGFSTIQAAFALDKALAAAGKDAKPKPFTVVRRYRTTPRPGEVLLVSTGGTSFFYVPGRDAEIIRSLAALLQTSNFAGVIFTRDGGGGTFKLADAFIDTPDAPDLAVSARWDSEKNEHGVPGRITADATKSNWGTHGSLSEFCIHNTLIAAGPDIRAGFRNELPTGNVDVAPTILHLLGIRPEQPLDGRILAEALDEKHTLPAPETSRVEATAPLPDGRIWKQYLQFTKLGDAVYLDHGNAELVEK